MSPNSSSDFSPAAQEPDLDPLVQNLSLKKKKKKKKKRRCSEMEDDVETLTSPAPATTLSPSQTAHEKKSRKKKKKRKHEEEDGETMKESECVQSHLEASTQEEDWCQNGSWSLTSHSDAEPSAQKMRLSATSPTQHESKRIQQETEPTRKKKKKKKRRNEQEENVQEINPTCSRSERDPEVETADILDGAEDLLMLNNKLTIKKKKSKLKEERRALEERKCSEDESAEEFASKKIATEDRKVGKETHTAPVVVWDSQVRDGYKRSKAPAANGSSPAKATNHVVPATWDGKRRSDVVEELLRNHTDKAYGANVLSWDGEVSAVSKDAIEDVRSSVRDTVIDEWDEEFDRGKVKKVKNYKREKWRSSSGSSIFQKIQDRRNKWSVTPGAKRVFGVRR